MISILENNAYNILGLSSIADVKNILKRSKEIVNRLKIDDVPIYDQDIPALMRNRSEESIKFAVQNLQNTRKKIKEFYFWYQIISDTDKNAYDSLKNGDYTKAMQLWAESSNEYQHQKNLALLYCMMLVLENNENYLKQSLELWQSIYKSNEFWEMFLVNYRAYDKESTSEEVFNDFRHSIPEFLSEIYSDLYKKHNDPLYLNAFQLAFARKSENVEKEVVSPIYESINTNVELLKNLAVINDDVVNEEEVSKIKPLIETIQSNMNELIDLGIYEDSQTKIIRDMVAESVRSLAVALFRNIPDEKIESLLAIAIKIVGTSGQAQKVNHDIDVVHWVKNTNKILDPIFKLKSKKDYVSALKLINEGILNCGDDLDLHKAYINEKRECTYDLAHSKWSEGAKQYKSNNIDYSLALSLEAKNIIYDNLDLFELNKEAVDGLLKEVEEDMKKLNKDNYSGLASYRKSHFESIEKSVSGYYAGAALILMIDYYMDSAATRVLKQKSQDETFNSIIGFVLFFIVIAIFNYFKS